MSNCVQAVPVNFAENAKFTYLIKTVDAVDRAHELSLKFLKDVQSDEGITGYMEFDWRNIVQFVQPQLQLIFLQDSERNPAAQRFMRFPFAVIVVRTAQVVVLDSVFELEPDGFDIHPDVEEVANALQILESTVRTLEGRRSDDGLKMINQLKRVLRTEL